MTDELHADEIALLLASAAGTADASQQAEVARLLDDQGRRGVQARSFLGMHRALKALAADDDTHSAPEELVRRVARDFPAERRSDVRRGSGGVIELIARLIFDSRTAELALRSDDLSGSYRLAFGAEESGHEIDVEIDRVPGEPARRVTAQVTGLTDDSELVRATVTEQESGAEAAVTRVRARDVFVVRLMPGTYALSVDTSEGLIRVPRLDVG